MQLGQLLEIGAAIKNWVNINYIHNSNNLKPEMASFCRVLQKLIFAGGRKNPD